jgi:tetratricopeptide (TPR) repeat protein
MQFFSFFHRPPMRESPFAQVSFWIFLVLIFFLPLCFFPFGADVLEVHKQTLLVFGVSLSALCLLFTKAGGGETKKWAKGLLWPLSVFVVAIGFSAWFSDAPFLSWIGGIKQEYTSFLSLVFFALFSFLASTIVYKEDQWKKITTAVLISSLLAGGAGILSLFGFSFPNTIGTAHLLSVYLVASFLFVLGFWLFVFHRSVIFSLLTGLLFLEMLTLLLVMNYWVLWMILGVGALGVILGVFFLMKPFHFSSRFLLPIFLAVVSVVFCFVSTPLSRFAPMEVVPNMALSFQVARDTLASKSWLFGSGPGTFVYDFASFKPPSINETIFWQTRFDSAFSFVLTLLATTGIFGVLAWMGLMISGFWSLTRSCRKHQEELPLMLAMFGSFLALSFSFFVSGANLTVLLFWFFLLGLLFALHKEEERRTSHKWRKGFVIFVSILLIAGIAAGAGLSAERYLAEAAFAKAMRLDREGASMTEVIVALDQAATRNRFYDVYYRNLASALLTQSLEEMGRLELQESISDMDQERLQAITASAINAATKATDLSPFNGLNWQMRGRVYRALLSLYANASDAAVTSCLQATQLEPNNPVYWMDLGQTYQKAAEVRQGIVRGQGVDPRQDDLWHQLLMQAESAFNTALDCKMDYAPAHYYLSLVYEAQGRLDEAVGKMESVLRYNPSDVGAYFQIGLLYLERGEEGDMDRAGEAFAQAITLAPSYANAHWFLATVYEQKDLLEYAILEIEKVLEIDPGNPLAQARLSRLRAGVAEEKIPEALEE